MGYRPRIHFCPINVVSLLLCVWLIEFVVGPEIIKAEQGQDAYNLAIGFYKQKRWSLAAQTFHKFLKDQPKHVKIPYGRLYLGLTLVNLQRYDEARDVLRKFVEDYPNNRNLRHAIYRVAECSYLLDDLKAARSEFQDFLKRAPKDPLVEWALPYLADAQLRLNDAKAAVDNFNKSLKKFPQGEMAEDSRFGLARAYEALHKESKAIELYRQLAANPNGARAPQAQLKLATQLFDTGDFAQAATAYLKIPQQFPKSSLTSLARLNAGYSYYQLGNYRDAIAQFNLSKTDKRHVATASYWQGLSYKAIDDFIRATAVLEETFQANQNNPLGEYILYHWADSEFRRGRFVVSQKLFLDVINRWPQSELAAHSLCFAVEAALGHASQLDVAKRSAQFAVAEGMIQRFLRDYTGSDTDSDLLVHHELLHGRLLDSQGSLLDSQGDKKGAKSNFEAAISHFRKVVDAGESMRRTSQARILLTKTQQKLQDHSDAIKSIQPLVEQVTKSGERSEFTEALVLYGNSLLLEKNYQVACEAVTEYLKMRPNGEMADRAITTRALAKAHQGHKKAALADWKLLIKQHADSTLVPRMTHQLAEIAYDAKDWDWSLQLFASLAEMTVNTSDHAVALSGLAWSQYENKQYKQAAETFSQIVDTHSMHDLAAESAYKVGDALQETGHLQQAAEQYAKALKTFNKSRYGYLAGLQSARILGRLQQFTQADAAYEELLKHFPSPNNLDRLLDEWALLHYETKNYKRADEIFRRLIQDVPDSDLADEARYNLAESDLVAGKSKVAKQAFYDLQSSPKSDGTVQQDSLYRLIGIAVEEQNWTEVQKYRQQLGTRFPNNRYRWEVDFYTAKAQLHLNQLKQAKQRLVELKNQKNNSTINRTDWFPYVWILLGETCCRLKEYNSVATTVNEFKTLNSKSPIEYRVDEILGRSYKNQRKFEEARSAFKKVIVSKHGRWTETAAKSQLLIAETFFLQKDYKLALQEYFKVYTLYDFSEWKAAALFQVAICDELLNQWDKAVQSYEILLKEFPESEFATKAQPRLRVARQTAIAQEL